MKTEMKRAKQKNRRNINIMPKNIFKEIEKQLKIKKLLEKIS